MRGEVRKRLIGLLSGVWVLLPSALLAEPDAAFAPATVAPANSTILGPAVPAPSGPGAAVPRLPLGPEADRCAKPPGCPPPCDPIPECPPPVWYGRLSALILKRDADRDIAFATEGVGLADDVPIPGDVVLSTEDLESAFSGGGEILVGRMIVPTHYLEFSYFGINSWEKSAAVRDADGNLFSPFSHFGTDPDGGLIAFDNNNLAWVRSYSRLNNFELNLRHELPMPPIRLNTSFLFGGRAMVIEESFDYLTQSAVATNAVNTKTDNRLLGLQVGGLFEFHVEPCWWIDFRAMGAICQNKIGLDSAYAIADATGTRTFVHSNDDNQTAFVGDLSLSLICECSCNVTLEVGYRSLWITGLALAAENMQTNPEILELGPPQLFDEGEIVYHGPFAGVTVRW